MSKADQIKLLARSRAAGWAAKLAPAELDKLLSRLPGDPYADRLLSGFGSHEDAAILSLPPASWWNSAAGAPPGPAPDRNSAKGAPVFVPLSELAMAQTVDVLSPVLNDPFKFGQVAAANSLSDIYAMGGKPWSAMNILGFPSRDLPLEIGAAILNGGADKMAEAQVALAGGHSLEDSELKYGLSVTGFVRRDAFAGNAGLQAGDILLLSKPLGIGVLSTSVKAELEDAAEMEKEIFRWAGLLNSGPAEIIRRLSLRAATDITGFGLAGHLLEMAEASGKHIRINSKNIPLLPRALELADSGLLPAGCHANRRHCGRKVNVADNVPLPLSDLCFDPQTSGGMILAVPAEKLKQASAMLVDYGHLAVPVAEVFDALPSDESGERGAPGATDITGVIRITIE